MPAEWDSQSHYHADPGPRPDARPPVEPVGHIGGTGKYGPEGERLPAGPRRAGMQCRLRPGRSLVRDRPIDGHAPATSSRDELPSRQPGGHGSAESPMILCGTYKVSGTGSGDADHRDGQAA